MNPTKQGKTNWKYIIIVAILAVIVGGGIWGWQYWWTTRKEAKPPEIKLPEKEFVEVTLERLKEGENKIGSIIVKKIEPEQVEPSSVFIEESLGRTSKGDFLAALTFKHKNNTYVIQLIQNIGSGGAFYTNYLYLLANKKLQPIEFENSPLSNYWFRAAGEIEVPEPGYLLIDYNDYLYVISWSVGQGGYRNFYGLTEIHILDENGEVTDNKYFDKPSERVPEGASFIYPKATSLIEKGKKIYIKISNAEDNIDKYYLLGEDSLTEGSL